MKYHLSMGHSGPIYPLPIFYILENLGSRLFEGQTNSPHLTHLFPPQYKNSDLPPPPEFVFLLTYYLNWRTYALLKYVLHTI